MLARDAARSTPYNRSFVGRDSRDAGGAGVERKSAIEKERTRVRVLITLNGRARIVEAAEEASIRMQSC